MGNDFRLKFLFILVASSLVCSPYAQAESAGQKRKIDPQSLEKQLESLKDKHSKLESERDRLKDKLAAAGKYHKLDKEEIDSLKENLKRIEKAGSESFKKDAKISELKTKLTAVTVDRDFFKKRAKNAEEDRDNFKSKFARLNEYYKTTKEENLALKRELKDSQLAYIREANSSSRIKKENEQLADELAGETRKRERLEKKWKDINKEVALLRKSTPVGRKEKKETLVSIYGDLAMRGSKFSQEELVKDKEKIHQALGYVYLLNGNFKEAIAFYNKALKLNPFVKDVYYNLGYLYTRIGKYKLAVNSYQKALKGDKSDDDIYYNLALIYGKYLRNEEKSNEYYKKISEK